MELLVVDDDPVFREELAELLRSEGHGVECASSAADAAPRVTRGRWDGVLTDVRMPQYSGLDLVKDVRRRAPATYCVVVTGQADEGTERLALEAGAVHFLAKPFTLAQLDEAIRTLAEAQDLRSRLCPTVSPGELVERTLDDPRAPVGWLSDRAPPDGAVWSSLDLDASNPWTSVPEVEHFCQRSPGALVVLDVGPRLLQGIGPSPTVVFVGRLRAAVPARSPVVLQVDLPSVGDETLLRLGWAVTGRPPSAALAAIALPAQRRVLARLSTLRPGESATFDPGPDSRTVRPHLERLREAGAVEPDGTGWRLTAEGRVLAEFVEARAAGTSARMFSSAETEP